MATAFESTRVGIAKYLVPLAFVYNPSLLLVGPKWVSVISTALALAGLWILSIGLEGWFRGRINGVQRFAAVGAAVLILLPPGPIAGVSGYLWNAAGFVIAAMLLVPRFRQSVQSPSTGTA